MCSRAQARASPNPPKEGARGGSSAGSTHRPRHPRRWAPAPASRRRGSLHHLSAWALPAPSHGSSLVADVGPAAIARRAARHRRRRAALQRAPRAAFRRRRRGGVGVSHTEWARRVLAPAARGARAHIRARARRSRRQPPAESSRCGVARARARAPCAPSGLQRRVKSSRSGARGKARGARSAHRRGAGRGARASRAIRRRSRRRRGRRRRRRALAIAPRTRSSPQADVVLEHRTARR